MRVPLRLYRLLLKLYPAGFRDEYAAPLQRQFKDDYAELQAPRDRLRFWIGTAIDVLKSAPPQLAREFAQDAAHTMRLWRRNPWPTTFAILVLAIAIGANTGVFSVLNALLLRSLPFKDPERLAVLRTVPTPLENFHTWRRASPYLADAAVYDTIEVNVEANRAAGRLRLTESSFNFFSVLGTEAVLGRTFAPGEDAAGANAVAVLGHGVWRQMFGEDPRVIGSSVRVNGTPLTIVGVAPEGFDYPQRTDLWSPTVLDFRRIPKTGSALFFFMFGRLKPGMSWEQAQQTFRIEAAHSGSEDEANARNRPALRPLQEELAGRVRSASMILMAGVVLLLLLACANVANMLLARTAARSNELMIRTALGASRARLMQQLLTETVLLSVVAAAAGLLIAVWIASIAASTQPPELSSQAYSVLDWRVLTFALALSFVTGLVFGVGPALYVTRREFSAYGKHSAATANRSTARAVLIGTQIAVTIVLLTGAVALGRAFVSLLRVDMGYELESIATMSVSVAGSTWAGSRARAYYDQVLQRVRDVPGVRTVSMTEALPLAIEGVAAFDFQLDHAGPRSPLTMVTSVSPGYFITMGSPVVAGREFLPHDLSDGEPLAIVNDEFARVFGGPSAVVDRLITGQYPPPHRIIGVVKGMRNAGPAFAPRPQLFLLSKSPRAASVVVKIAGRARDRLAMIRDVVQSVDPKVPVFNVKTMEDRFGAAVARPRFYATAVVFFAGLALLLAVVGIYGTVSYAVVQRSREIGIRLALGTTPSHVRAMLLRQMLAIIAVGGIVGVALALGAGQYIQSLVEGAGGAITVTASTAVIGTAIVTSVAVWQATRHIVALDIAKVLRTDTGD